MRESCNPRHKLGGFDPLETDGKLILPFLSSPAVLHLCRSTLHYVLRTLGTWLVTFVFHVPLQGVRLSTFFARLALYIIFLWPAMLCGLIYWAFAGKDIFSVSYKDSCGIECWAAVLLNFITRGRWKLQTFQSNNRCCRHDRHVV